MRKKIHFLTWAVLALFIPLHGATSAKEQTVTLQISGMTCGDCLSTVQSALEHVKRREGSEDEDLAAHARSRCEVRPGANQSGGPDQSGQELSWHACLRRQGQAEVSPWLRLKKADIGCVHLYTAAGRGPSGLARRDFLTTFFLYLSGEFLECAGFIDDLMRLVDEFFRLLNQLVRAFSETINLFIFHFAVLPSTREVFEEKKTLCPSRCWRQPSTLGNSQPVPQQREQSLRPALTIRKGSPGIARPEALQRLQLRIGSLTRTSPLPRHTGQASGIGLPSQNPQVFGE